MMPEGSAIVSIEFKVNLLSPSVGERFVAQGRLIRGGKTISVVSGDVHAFDASGAAKHVATMTGTMMRVEPRGGQTG
jgi:acyl-coenzyme A thioesterase PaaI-like protein